jgi:hypothetical protein
MVDTPSTVLPRKILNKARTETPASVIEKGQEIPRESPLFLNQTVRVLRDQGKTTDAIRLLAQGDGTVSTAVFNYVQVAMSGYTLMAYQSGSQQYDAAGTQLARQILASMNTLYDYTLGYADKETVDSVVETALREVVLTGGLCAELVLNKQRLPERIQLPPLESIKWKSNGDGTKYPAQSGQDGDIDLNIPNLWIATSHKDTSKVYAGSMMEAALNTAFYYAEFVEDMRRAQRRGGHSRLIITLDGEKITAAAPNEVRSDPVKLKAFMESIRGDVETTVNKLEPEDAIITYDSVSADLLSAENVKADYSDLVTAISGMLATSLKSHPSILGLRLGGSQSLSNTESLVFLKAAAGIQRPVQDVMSRALTLATRLYGSDVYVKFKFNPINLRPEDELEAFKTMRQARILQLLSIGFYTDEQAAEILGTGLRPAGAPPLSGTMFLDAKTGIDAEKASPNNDPQGRALQPDTPKNGGGGSNGE